MDDADLGTLTGQGDRWTLTFTRRLAHSREKVWRAVTEPEHLAVWYPQEIVGERKAGAPLRFVSSAGDGFDGQMLVFDPPEIMEFTWGADRLRIELQADGAVTLLSDVGAELPHGVGRPAVGLEVVLAAEPVVVHARYVRPGRVKGRRGHHRQYRDI